ncbi:hypothetical protein RFI_07951 [Reticulomyxa filosa]|uniref:Thioredoxin domain-containing protein n=1 Tax=Reticulomyxa filosa TaxID=46433 RepID=X6NT98_RETFI|nr:hypothetical protein RFI_07951 [Reticulomyxa filosa]|eukprot:ETO29178.1 hypothetical protein RFI_07951 [Reticulomyxa filosa]
MASANGTWSQVKDVLRDVAVDKALEEAQTSYLYQQLYEEQKGLRVEIQDAGAKHVSATEKEKAKDSDNDSLDEFEKEIENDPELRKIQEERREQLKEQFRQKQEKLSKGFGHYDQMDEKDMLKMAADTQYVVVHFSSNEFKNCSVMDHHLALLAPKNTDVRFVKCDAKKSPFVTQRWKIRTLPTLCVVVHGFLVDKVIGFTELGNRDDFPTIALERRLAKTGICFLNIFYTLIFFWNLTFSLRTSFIKKKQQTFFLTFGKCNF